MTRFWCGVISRDHIQRGLAGGFCQVCHGRRAPLARMTVGDGIVLYSPTIQFRGTARCQRFSAIGKVQDKMPYQFQMTQDFVPFRRDVRYFDAREADIHPLLDRLEFTRGNPNWGYKLRLGHFELSKSDFRTIAQAMLPTPGRRNSVGRKRPTTAARLARTNRSAGNMERRKIVVTGLGVLASNGTGVKQFWRNSTEGVNGVTPHAGRPQHGFASRVYGMVKDFDPFAHGLPSRIAARGGRHVQFALVASSMAVEDAGIDISTLDADRFGVTISTAIADAGSMERDLLFLSDDGRSPVDAARAEARFADSLDFGRAGCETARRFGARGPVTTLSTGCTAGLDALGFALDEIREGRAEVMLAGASEAPLCPLAIASFEALAALDAKLCGSSGSLDALLRRSRRLCYCRRMRDAAA